MFIIRTYAVTLQECNHVIFYACAHRRHGHALAGRENGRKRPFTDRVVYCSATEASGLDFISKWKGVTSYPIFSWILLHWSAPDMMQREGGGRTETLLNTRIRDGYLIIANLNYYPTRLGQYKSYCSKHYLIANCISFSTSCTLQCHVGSHSSVIRAPATKAGGLGSIPGGCPGFFSSSSWITNVDEMKIVVL